MSAEIVLAKRPRFAVPATCPGCGGEVHLVRKLPHSTLWGSLYGAGLVLHVGFCRPCSDALTRAGRPAWWLLLGAVVAALAAAGGIVAAPVAPQIVVALVPCVVAALAIALLRHRLRGRDAAARRDDGPYRTMARGATPPVPIQLRYLGASRATLHCANEEWARGMAMLNQLELRVPRARPDLPFAGLAMATGMMVAAAAGWVAHARQWPRVVIDNPTDEVVTFFVDGVARWQVPPRSPETRAFEVRLPRGAHRVSHQLASRDRPEEAVELVQTGMFASDRKVYDPLASGCYLRFPVVYGGAKAPPAEYLPQTRVLDARAHHVFEAPPETKSLQRGQSETVWVLERDELCLSVAERGCAPADYASLRTCMEGVRDNDRKRADKLDACRAQAPPACWIRDAAELEAARDGS